MSKAADLNSFYEEYHKEPIKFQFPRWLDKLIPTFNLRKTVGTVVVIGGITIKILMNMNIIGLDTLMDHYTINGQRDEEATYLYTAEQKYCQPNLVLALAIGGYDAEVCGMLKNKLMDYDYETRHHLPSTVDSEGFQAELRRRQEQLMNTKLIENGKQMSQFSDRNSSIGKIRGFLGI